MNALNRLASLALLIGFFVLVSCNEKDSKKSKDEDSDEFAWKTKESAGYEYKYVQNDPSNARFYTLDNGMTVILSPSKKKPRIQTYIATKAGSKTDPANHTGLAHYLEHMLFKGTDKYGSLDWEKEEPLLEDIEGLYEEYNSTEDEEKRKAIYKKIDSVSGEAAKYAIANEYDKMLSGMGAEGTNAFTSFEETVYTEDIPSNAMDKFLAVQSERFRNPVFRLFHTELEAVYEEKNRSLDSDGSKVFEAMFENLFQNHNYGKQTTIGTIDHLKNPSLKEIRKYFENYYVPNNMGVVMAGDFDPDEVIKKIDDAFGYMEEKEVPEYEFDEEEEIEEPIVKEVSGPEPENIMLGYRFPGIKSDDAQMLQLVGAVLTNGSAGLIDLNLVKKQKLLRAYAFPYVLKDYSTLLLAGNPTEGQDLDEVRDLLLEQIEKLKEGDFSDDLITSIINNERKDALEANEDYGNRAYMLMDNFTSEGDWLKQISYADWLEDITKEDVIDFANKYFKDNYVAVYKLQEEDSETEKVEKPEITPVEVNREDQSDFLQEIADMKENKIEPVWLDYDKDIDSSATDQYTVLAVENEDNDLFSMDYYFETGSWANKILPIAAGYLDYIGTDEKSAEEISRNFYKLASKFNVSSSDRTSSISLSGLQENFNETVEMFDDLIKNAVADEEALESYIKSLKKNRKNAKEDKGTIMRGLQNYALYGEDNPFNNELSDEELDDLEAEELIEVLRDLRKYKHKILYHGPKSASDIADTMEEIHDVPDEFKELPEETVYEEKTMDEDQVLIANYDMVQAEIYWMRNNGDYDEELESDVSFFNQYFGGGMNSIVFQTIRESKALAYSTYAYYSLASRPDNKNSFMAYVGTQADKFSEAVDGMNELLNELPESSRSVDNAKKGLRKKIASERITGRSILYNYLSAQRMGRDKDVRKQIYESVENKNFEDLDNFFEEEVSNKNYTYCIVTGKGTLDQEKLNEIGGVKRLSLEEIFGY